MRDICILFENIAADVWGLVARNNARGNSLSEDGISRNIIISRIQDFVLATGSNKILAQRAKNESQRGADVELYVEYRQRRYLRYLFQAKALKSDGTYHDVNHRVRRTELYQWDLLSDYSRIVGAIPYYLLYNGIPDFSCTNRDCYGYYDEKQYGCAVSEIAPIKAYCLDNDTGRYPFKIDEGSTPIGVPWRYIPCCGINNETEIGLQSNALRLYSPDEIDMDKSFDKIFRSARISGPPTEVEQDIDVQRINDEVAAMGWTPGSRIVISKFGMKRGGGLYLMG